MLDTLLNKKQLLYPFFIAVLTALLLLACANAFDDSPKLVATNYDQQLQKSEHSPQSITVFAAASLTDVMAEIARAFELKKNVKVKLNLASSGTLARQMEHGAAADVFISASKKWADYVEERELTEKSLRKNIASNNLVLIAPSDSTLNVPEITSDLNFVSLLGKERLSIGDPEHVPAGKYAKEALEHFGWYANLEKKLLPAKDVRFALMVVELGEAPVGIVYRTDAQKSEKVRILSIFPDKSHKPIVYIAAVCKKGKASVDFFSFLVDPHTAPIWEKFGFNQ